MASTLRNLRARQPGLMLLFLGVIAVVLGAIAFTAGRQLESSVREEVLAEAETTARLFAELALQPDEYENGRLTAEAIEDLTQDIGSSTAVRAARVWERGGRLRFASMNALRENAAPSRELTDAFGGNVGSKLTVLAPRSRAQRDGEQLIQVDVPVRTSPEARPTSVLQLYLSYGSVKRSIDAGTRRIYVILAAAALLIYLALVPTVRRASKAIVASRARNHARVRAQMKRAIERRELELHYQPQLDVASGKIVAVEALVRWRHPERGMVRPDEFLPQSEEAGVIDQITLYVLDEALRQCADWKLRGIDVSVAVNISARNLHDLDLPGKLAELLDKHSLTARSLLLELTEGAVMREGDDGSRRVLDALHELGCELSVDDFGTGYSSLARLDDLPMDELKIDRAFIARMGDADHNMVATIIALASELDMRVVAEGVETAEQLAQLERLGCDRIQGYHIGAPLPPNEVEPALARVTSLTPVHA